MPKKNRFVSLFAKIQKLSSDDGSKVRLRPPATDAQRSVLEARFGKPLPRELAELIEVTTGIEGGGPFSSGDFDLDPDEETVTTLRPWEGFEVDLVRVYHWGNGDGLYLDLTSGECELWWFGHDPHECIFVARSLLEYFKRLADPDNEGNAWSPVYELEPIAPSDVAVDEDDEEAREFLSELPEDTLVFHLRGEELPLEMESDWKERAFHRHGDIIARVLAEEARPPPDDPEATRLLELAQRYAASGEHEKADATLAQAAAIEPYHSGLAVARLTLSGARARSQIEPTLEARRRLAEGDRSQADNEPAVVTGVSSVYLRTKHPSLGDIAIFQPKIHTPVKEGDRVRLIGVTLSNQQLRASDYTVAQSN